MQAFRVVTSWSNRTLRPSQRVQPQPLPMPKRSKITSLACVFSWRRGITFPASECHATSGTGQKQGQDVQVGKPVSSFVPKSTRQSGLEDGRYVDAPFIMTVRLD